MNNTSTLSAAVGVMPPSSVENQINELQNVSLNISDLIKELEGYLEPVLTPDAQTAGVSGIGEKRPERSPLVEKLSSVSDYLAGRANHLRSLIRRLEI